LTQSGHLAANILKISTSLTPRLPSRLTAAASLSQPWLFNLIDNAVLQQRRIKILFPIAM
jgi:hypothetical protein